MGMFGGGKRGFDWKAAAIAFANPEAGAMYARNRDKRAADEAAMAAEMAERQVAVRAMTARGVPDDAAAVIASDPQRRAAFLGGEYETKLVAPGSSLAGRNPATGAFETQYRGAPRQMEIDGRIVNEDGTVVYDSPYPKVVPGPDGSFNIQPRLGLPGRAPPPQQPQMRDDPLAPLDDSPFPGFSFTPPANGGAGRAAPRPFRGGFNPYIRR